MRSCNGHLPSLNGKCSARSRYVRCTVAYITLEKDLRAIDIHHNGYVARCTRKDLYALWGI